MLILKNLCCWVNWKDSEKCGCCAAQKKKRELGSRTPYIALPMINCSKSVTISQVEVGRGGAFRVRQRMSKGQPSRTQGRGAMRIERELASVDIESMIRFFDRTKYD